VRDRICVVVALRVAIVVSMNKVRGRRGAVTLWIATPHMETFSTIHRNVREICRIEHEALQSRSAAERLGDFVAQQAGRIWFAELHVIWFVAWALLNSGNVAFVHPFDRFPYPFLTLVVSLEAIFLSLFILISQNRASRQADRRSHLGLQSICSSNQSRQRRLSCCRPYVSITDCLARKIRSWPTLFCVQSRQIS
jgi:hypothetical protein